MITVRGLHTVVVCGASVLALAGTSQAQSLTNDEVKRELADMRAEIRALRAEIDALRGRQDAPRPAMTLLRAVQPASFAADRVDETVAPTARTSMPTARAAQPDAPQPQLELLQAQVGELAQVKVESTSRMPVKIFGTIHTNVFANSGTPNWLENPNLVNPTPTDGHGGTFSATLRQTRLGFTVDGPTISGMRTSGAMAMDFFGGIPGFATGQVMGLPRLLVAFARIETDRTAVEIGQDHMILAPLDPTSLAAFSFPSLFRSGNLYLRTPQVRLEQALTSRLRLMGGIVAPIAGDVPGEEYRFVPPALSGERSNRPSLQARLAFSTAALDAPRHLNVGVAGHYGWEFKSGTRVESSAGAVDFALRRDLVGAAGEFFVGDNIDAFGGASGIDGARTGGGWAEVQLYPFNRLTVAAGAGLDDLRSPPPTAPRRRNRSAYGSAIVALTPEVQASFEYRWLATLPGAAGAERRNHHFDWTLVYKF